MKEIKRVPVFFETQCRTERRYNRTELTVGDVFVVVEGVRQTDAHFVIVR